MKKNDALPDFIKPNFSASQYISIVVSLHYNTYFLLPITKHKSACNLNIGANLAPISLKLRLNPKYT